MTYDIIYYIPFPFFILLLLFTLTTQSCNDLDPPPRSPIVHMILVIIYIIVTSVYIFGMLLIVYSHNLKLISPQILARKQRS